MQVIIVLDIIMLSLIVLLTIGFFLRLIYDYISDELDNCTYFGEDGQYNRL